MDNDDEVIDNGNDKDQNDLTNTTTFDPSTTTAITTTIVIATDSSTVAIFDLTKVTVNRAITRTTALNIKRTIIKRRFVQLL